MKLSLSVKINLCLVAVVCLCILFLGIVEFYQTKSEIENNLDVTMQKVSKRLSNSLVMPLWNIDTEVARSIVNTEMIDPNIFAVVITDALSEQYMVAKTRNRKWEIVDTPDPKAIVSAKNVELPITYNSQVLGTVRVFVSDSFSAAKLVSGLTVLTTRITVLLGFIILVLILFVNLIVSRPILLLSRNCKKVAYGDFSVKLDTRRNDEIGSLARSFSYMRDAIQEKIGSLNTEITDRKRSEKEIQRLRAYLSNIVDSMPSVLVAVDNSGMVTEWNLEAENVTGNKKNEALGRLLPDILTCMENHFEEVSSAINLGEVRRGIRVAHEVTNLEKLFDVTIYPLVSNGAEGAVIRLDDVTERVRLEAVMIQTEKMMSVGGLAAGMAHEINNPLAGMLQSVQVIQNRLSSELARNHEIAEGCGITMKNIECYINKREVPKMLEAIVESGERASRIIRNMLSFSRKSISRYTPCNITQLLDKTVDLASNDYDLKKKFDFRKIEIIRQYDSDVMEVRCDPTTIQQVFFNILKNAAQAMIASVDKNTNIKELYSQPRIILRVYRAEDHVKIAIEDNGIGMDEGTSNRIFEPFFTTKNIGIGTGLGLSVSYFIIKENHKGFIDVTSKPGEGSVFTVSLPC